MQPFPLPGIMTSTGWVHWDYCSHVNVMAMLACSLPSLTVQIIGVTISNWTGNYTSVEANNGLVFRFVWCYSMSCKT